MTLIVAAGNKDFAVLAADRRLTSNGKLVDDEANKATILACYDARMAIAFTGLATWGSFSTEKWLLESLSVALEKSNRVQFVLDTLKDKATKEFGDLKIAAKHKHLTFIFLGYVYADEPGLNCWTISNSQTNGGTFLLSQYMPESDSGIILRAEGSTGNIGGGELSNLKNILKSDKPYQAIEAKSYDIIKKTSFADNVIGEQSSCCVIHKSKNKPMCSTYYSGYSTQTAYGVNSVFGLIEGSKPMVTSGAKLIVGDQLPPVTVPRVGRNDPCSCGSGMKYKKCHGKMSYPYLPLRSEISFSDREFPSGNKFIVEGRGASSL